MLFVELEFPLGARRSSYVGDSRCEIVPQDIVREGFVLRRRSRVGIDVEEQHYAPMHVA